MKNFGYYENKIITEFIKNEPGINLEMVGKKNFEKIIPVNLQETEFIVGGKLSDEIQEIISFLKNKQLEYQQENYYKRPIWFRINIMDQAINEYLGIGYINIKEGWLDFIIYSLGIDRADQGGDGIFTIFDTDFNWAVNFELSQDDSCLVVQKMEK